MTQGNEIIIYQSEDKKIEVSLKEETVWLSLNQIAKLFEKDKSVISRHIQNIFKTGELDKNSTVAFFATVQKEGPRKIKRKITYYNLECHYFRWLSGKFKKSYSISHLGYTGSEKLSDSGLCR